MVISLSSLKGGTGKTTVSINLAVYYASFGNNVILVDADENENCIEWSATRGQNELNPVTVVGLKNPSALRNNIHKLEQQSDIVIIDGTPAINEMASTIMLLSDLNIFPLQASPLDVWAFNDRFVPRFNDCKALRPDLQGVILLNNIDIRTLYSKEVENFAQECEIPLLETVFTDLQIYKNSISNGMGVIETKNEKAKHQVFSLGVELTKYLNYDTIESIEANTKG